jgi:hypothetical protein
MQKWMWRKAVHDANLCYGCHHICGNTTEDKRWDALFPSLLPKSKICNQTKTMRDVVMASNPVARWLWEAFIGNPLH